MESCAHWREASTGTDANVAPKMQGRGIDAGSSADNRLGPKKRLHIVLQRGLRG